MPEVFYSNFANIRASFYDVTIAFFRVSHLKESESGESEPVPEEMARVQMSPQHAKSLLIALQSNIGRYEEKHGVINIPAPADSSTAKNG